MTIIDDRAEQRAITGSRFAYQLVNVVKEYQQKDRTVRPLKGLNLQIDVGEFVTIQGPTGGGKSTLLQLLGALDTPTSGHVLLGGALGGDISGNVSGDRDSDSRGDRGADRGGDAGEPIDLIGASARQLQEIRARRIGFVFQAFNLIPTLTAAENVDMGLEPLDLDREERDSRIAHALTRVGLADRSDHRPSELSGGQQQRVSIARAIAKQPSVLLADEPTGNLDESMRDDILKVLEDLNADGLTLIVVTHDSAVAKRAGRRLRLAKGVVQEITN